MIKRDLVLAIIVLALSILLAGQGKTLSILDSSCDGRNLKNLEIKEIEILGDPEAPLLIEVYSDYQCVFGARYFKETILPIIDEYVLTGKASLIYYSLSFEGQKSQIAAEAAYCANDQGKFWEYHQEILDSRYQQHEDINYVFEDIEKVARKIDLDICEFNLCLKLGKYTELVEEQTRIGFIEKNINNTPVTFLNHRMVTDEKGESLGIIPYNILKEQIQSFI
ncbi:MAG: thioredoxin domain-containing protein [Candidatus Paceibacterota bacterium]|jgi:protein-disulfide isomerase